MLKKYVLLGTLLALSLTACGSPKPVAMETTAKPNNDAEISQKAKVEQEQKVNEAKAKQGADKAQEKKNKEEAASKAKLEAEGKLLLVDVKEFKGKKPSEIEALYGKPENIEKGSWGLKPDYKKVPYERYVYEAKGFSVMFIEGVAGRMEVIPKSKLTKEQIQTNSMAMLGLPVTKIDNDQRNIIRWLPKEGVHQVTAIFTDMTKKELESINIVLEEKYL
jgi:hypothetical protein